LVVLKDKISVLGPVLGLETRVLGPGFGTIRCLNLAVNFFLFSFCTDVERRFLAIRMTLSSDVFIS